MMQTASQTVVTILAALAGLAIVWLVWKRALLDAQSRAMQVQAEVIEAYERRIKQLEDDREEDRKEREKLRAEIAELRGEVKGQRDLAHAIIETVAESRVCMLAPDCEQRVTPSI